MAQSINLIPDQEVREQKKEKVVKVSSVFSILLLLIVAGVSAYFWYRTSTLQNQLNSLKTEIESHRQSINSLKDIEVIARTLDARYKIVSDIFTTRTRYSVLLDELNRRVPTNIKIESFGISGEEGNEINLSGTGTDYLSIARFIDTLSDGDYELAAPEMKKLFTDVTLNSVSLDGQNQAVSYTLVIKFDGNLLK